MKLVNKGTNSTIFIAWFHVSFKWNQETKLDPGLKRYLCNLLRFMSNYNRLTVVSNNNGTLLKAAKKTS